MDSGVRISGARGIALVGEHLRKMGNDRTIVNQMAKEIRTAGKPVKKAVKANALTMLPKKGGMNVWAARTRVNVRVRRAPSTAGIDFVAGRTKRGGKADIKRLDAGKLRAPNFPRVPFKTQWHLQTVPEGFASKAVEGPGLDEFEAACDRAIRKAIESL